MTGIIISMEKQYYENTSLHYFIAVIGNEVQL